MGVPQGTIRDALFVRPPRGLLRTCRAMRAMRAMRTGWHVACRGSGAVMTVMTVMAERSGEKPWRNHFEISRLDGPGRLKPDRGSRGGGEKGVGGPFRAPRGRSAPLIPAMGLFKIHVLTTKKCRQL